MSFAHSVIIKGAKVSIVELIVEYNI